MRSDRGEGRAGASGVVTQVLMRPSSVMVQGRSRRAEQVDQADRGTIAVATEGGSSPAKPMQEPIRAVIRAVLGRFLELNEQVNEFVNRYVDVFVEQADGLTEWRLKRHVGRIAESITFLDRAIAMLLKTSDDAQVGPDEPDRAALADYRDHLQRIRGSLRELGDNASVGVATSESRETAFDQLRSLTEATWGATTGVFKIASAIITRMLDQMPPWAPSSGTAPEVFSASARDSKSEFAKQVTVNG